MTAYYNENDPRAAEWLRFLVLMEHIPPGDVDERSIVDVHPDDLKGYTQCHFFAGIGGWPLALHLAGVPEDYPLWTGSAPCQPFSVAGSKKGYDDERHLAPTWLNLIAERRPPTIFGEQVASRLGRDWLADLRLQMEELGYAVGAADLCAAGVGAPHIRQRLYFGAQRLADAASGRPEMALQHTGSIRPPKGFWETNGLRSDGASGGGLADTERPGSQGRGSAERGGLHEDRQTPSRGATDNRPDPYNEQWANPDWIGCRDNKWRPVEPGTFPLANGISARVGRLRGYGNAIVPQLGAAFVEAFLTS